MRPTQLAPYVTALATGGGLLMLAAWGEWMNGNLITCAVDTAWAVVMLVCAAVLALAPPRVFPPQWSHRFEAVAVAGHNGGPAGIVLRCNRCDATVLPRTTRLVLPRLLAYSSVHTSLACEPHRAHDPEDTGRLAAQDRRHRRGPLGGHR